MLEVHLIYFKLILIQIELKMKDRYDYKFRDH